MCYGMSWCLFEIEWKGNEVNVCVKRKQRGEEHGIGVLYSVNRIENGNKTNWKSRSKAKNH